MSQVRLEFPILVEKHDSKFLLRPLLMDGQRVLNRRYGDGVRSLQKIVRKQFANLEPSKSLFEELLWYCFVPEIKFELPYFELRSGMQHIEGHFAIAHYTVNHNQYVCLPKFDHLTLRIPDHVTGRQNQHEFISSKIQQYFREMRKDNDHFRYQHLLSGKSDTFAVIKSTVEIGAQAFPFQYEPFDSFNLFSNQRSFDGAVELGKVGEDLSDFYPNDLNDALFRDHLIRLLRRSLFNGKPQSIVVVGQRGIGRTNLIHSVLKSYLDENKRKSLHKLQKVWLVDPLRVISGMSVVGQWERRFESILERLKARLSKVTDGKIQLPDILYIDNPVALLRVGKTSQTSLTLSHLLKPYMERRDFPIVIEATQQEWQKVQQMDRGFADLFQVMRLEPLSALQLDRVYALRRAQLEYEYRTDIDSKAMLTVLKTEPRFRGDGQLPGTVLSILETLAVRNQGKKMTEDRVYASLESRFHFKKEIVDRQAVLKSKQVSEFFQRNLIGQVAACDVLTSTVLAVKAQLTPITKPLNTMFFIGPTGVGKTEAVKLLASYLFDRPECLVRIDMNEFADADAIDRLIGGNYQRQGILTERVRYAGACVLLLDEIEKAHPRVHDLLLQLLDDGRLTDASGETTDFTQCIIVMTSNVGAREASSGIGFGSPQMGDSATYLRSLEQFFRPELLNRINNTVVFNELKLGDMTHLARLHLRKLLQRDGFSRRKTILNVDELCLDEIARTGYDATLGARALKRNLEKHLTHITAAQLAQMTTTDPMILNIQLVNGVPTTSITQLRFKSANEKSHTDISPTFSIEQYTEQLNQLESVDEALSDAKDSNDESLQYLSWRLSGSIRDISQPLQQFIWEKQERVQHSSLGRPLVFKMPRMPEKYKMYDTGFDFNSTFAMYEMRDFLRSIYQQADNAVNDDVQHLLHLMSESRLLFHAVEKLNERGVDRGILRFTALNNDPDSKALLESLIKRYSRLIDEKLGAIESTTETELSVSGCGLNELLDYESGVHLYVGERFRQIPFYIQYISDIHKDCQELLPEILDVVRLYTINKSTNGYDDIVDLRLGMTSKADGVGEHTVLLFPAISN